MNQKILFSILLFLPLGINCQRSGLRILPEGGLSYPTSDFKEVNVYAKRGMQLGLHLDKMWGKFGLGLYGGFDKNGIQFDDLLPEGNPGFAISRSETIVQYNWKKYLAGLGPVLEVDISKKLKVVLTSKIGLVKISYPDYGKYIEVGDPLNQVYTLYQTKNEDIEKKLNPMVLSALRLNFRATTRVGLSLSGNYLHVRNVLHSYSYLDADFNPEMSNEALIQTLRTAPAVTEVRKCHFNTVGVTVGLSFIIGGKESIENEKMDPPVPEYPEDGATLSVGEADSLVLQWLKESPAVDKANYNVWLYSVDESAREPDLLIFKTKTKRSLQAALPENVKLESGGTYRWEVQAVDDRRLRACQDGCYSISATFRVSGSRSEAVLRKTLDAGYYTLVRGSLNFRYDEEYVNNGNVLEFSIYDKNRAVVISNTSSGVSVNISYKDNRCSLNIKAINPSLPPGFYVLEVKGKKGEISMLRFKL